MESSPQKCTALYCVDKTGLKKQLGSVSYAIRAWFLYMYTPVSFLKFLNVVGKEDWAYK